jgi:NAD(P)H-flavin reductase
VLEDLPDLSGWGAYLSGPPPMVSAARRALVAQGLDPTCLHSDSFDYAFETGHDAQ